MASAGVTGTSITEPLFGYANATLKIDLSAPPMAINLLLILAITMLRAAKPSSGNLLSISVVKE